MAVKKGDRIRLGVLVAVTLIFLVFCWVRFFAKKPAGEASRGAPAVLSQQAAGSPAEAPRGGPPLAAATATGASQASLGPAQTTPPRVAAVLEPARESIRDIFMPARAAAKAGTTVAGPGGAVLPPVLKLSGTIVDGRKPMAIINDQFLNVGSMIGPYRVAAITKNKVTLQLQQERLVLEVLKDPDKSQTESSR